MIALFKGLINKNQSYTHVYIAESPLQLLSAIEASMSDVGKKVLVISYGSSRRLLNNKHINSVIKYSNFDQIIAINHSDYRISNWLSWMYAVLCVFFLRNCIRTVYIGEWRSDWMHRLVEVSFCKNIVLLDDGVVILDVVKNKLISLNHNKLFFNSKNLTIKSKITDFLYMLVGSNCVANYKLKLFTVFSDLYNPDSLTVTKNNFNFLKSLLKKSPCDSIYYFGSRSSEANYLSLDNELVFMQNVYNKLTNLYPNDKFIYVPHRDSIRYKIDSIGKMGFVIRYIDSPVEVYFLEINERPRVISGSHSTALPNLMSIYDVDKIHVFKLPMSKVLPGKLNLAAETFEFYKRLGYDVIETE